MAASSRVARGVLGGLAHPAGSSHARQAVRFTRSNGALSVRRAEVRRRTGVLAVKAGMTSSWDVHGRVHALTVLHLDGCRVVQVKEKEKHGYTALQLGVCPLKFKKANKPLMGHFARWAPPADADEASSAAPSDASAEVAEGNVNNAASGGGGGGVDYAYRMLHTLEEFRVSPDAVLPVGTPLSAAHFFPGQYVDVQGVTKGKGFQGGMKRWGFGGGPASHGTSKAHRKPGSTGQCAQPARTFKGKKMPGRMGNKRRTAQSLLVHRIDVERNLVIVRGCVPGNKGRVCRITDSILRRREPRMQLIEEGGRMHFPTIPKATLAELPKVWEWADEPVPVVYPYDYAH